MKIDRIEMKLLSTPLKKPFKTALRQTSVSDNLIIMIHGDDGTVGYGGATATAVITGDTLESVGSAVENYIAPAIIGMDIEDFDMLLRKVDSVIVHNSSAKAAVDIALYDLFGKHFRIPLYKLFGGAKREVESDITVSVNSPEEMAQDAIEHVSRGYTTLKTKVGLDSKLDIVRVKAIRDAVGKDIKLRLDANQGWQAKEAVRTIRKLEDLGLDLELVEQPVKAYDIDGLQYVTEHVDTLIMADEALFCVQDCFTLLKRRAADILNIKLMKSGGLHHALTINALAESCGVECMIGCMIESKIGITAAAHLACGKLNITRADLDAVDLMAQDPIEGGVIVKGNKMLMPEGYGLGIVGLR